MNQSPTTEAIAEALVNFQAEMPTVAKDKTAKVPLKAGGSYSYTYADLGSVVAAAGPLLVKHGLAFTCLPREASRGYELVGTLLHTSGEWLTGALPLHGNQPQELGSAITYARRYLLGCMTGIVTDDDTDARGHETTGATRGWDGPSTAMLLNQIDEDAKALGVDYATATAKWRTANGGLDVDALDSLDPWIVAPLAAQISTHRAKIEAGTALLVDPSTAQPAAE